MVLSDILKPYSSKFIRDISQYTLKTKSDNPDKQLFELVRYAFGKYPVCKTLSNVWGVPRDTDGAQHRFLNDRPLRNSYNRVHDFKAWYVCVATGGSLFKEHAKGMLTKKEVHCLLCCHHDIFIDNAIVYAIAKAHCDSDGIAFRIACSKLAEKTTSEFWVSVIRWFADNTPSTYTEINDLVDYISHAKQERQDFSMSGQTLPALTKKKIDWHYALRRVKAMGDAQWEGHYMPDEVFEVKHGDKVMGKWIFHQIKNTKELAAEGTRMHHCVYSYKQGCVKGTWSIWSLSWVNEYGVEKPKITIELRDDGNIVQARGFANRVCAPEERAIIRDWAKKYDLRVTA